MRLAWGTTKACCRNLKTTTRPGRSDPIKARGRRRTAAVDADALKPGTLRGAYVLKKELASGGGGTVYEAQHRILGRRAAVKVLRRQLAASPQMVARFVQEARAVNMIKHPSIVDIFEFDDLPDGRPFYVMELLEGIDLRSILTERGRFPPGEVLEILEPVCSALQAAHDLGIVHRDLKASNIFIANVGGKRVVKLLDFGIAKLLHPDAGEGGLTVVGTRLGTSYTMAPEQIRGDGVDARTDIYALGVVLYHLLTGQYPFRAETMTDIERQHLEAPPPRPSQAAPRAAGPRRRRAALHGEDRRAPLPDASRRSSRRCATRSAPRPPSAEVTRARRRDLRRDPDRRRRRRRERRGAGRHVRDPRRHRAELPRPPGMTLPLQTGSAIIGARVLSGGRRARPRASATRPLALANELARRARRRGPRRTPTFTSTSSSTSAARSSRTRRRRRAARRSWAASCCPPPTGRRRRTSTASTSPPPPGPESSRASWALTCTSTCHVHVSRARARITAIDAAGQATSSLSRRFGSRWRRPCFHSRR